MVRRYDTEAMDELVARARAGDVDVEYLLDALQHYRNVYGGLLEDHEKAEDRLRAFDLWLRSSPD